MYNYDFQDEKIIQEWVEILISINDRELRGNILITEKNILIFRNSNKDSILYGRDIHEIPEYELQLKINLKNLNYIVNENNTIINLKENEIILFDLDLNKVKNS